MDIQMKGLSGKEHKVMSIIAGCVMTLQHMNAVEPGFKKEKDPTKLKEIVKARPKIVALLKLNLSQLKKINPAKATELTAALYKNKFLVSPTQSRKSTIKNKKQKQTKRIP